MSATTHEPPAPDLHRLLVVSPHLDDAVLSCGHLIAAATEARSLTVFAGAPTIYPSPPTAWDRDCGFRAGDDIMAVRQEEDAAALAALDATAMALGFLDLQYRADTKPDVDAIATAIRRALDEFRPTAVAFPLAIQHVDHQACTDAALKVRRRGEDRDWLCYAEFPYVWREPDLAVRRLSALRRQRVKLTPALTAPDSPVAKVAALRAYGSQLVGLELEPDLERVAAAPEQLWWLTDRDNIAQRGARWAGYRTGILK